MTVRWQRFVTESGRGGSLWDRAGPETRNVGAIRSLVAPDLALPNASRAAEIGPIDSPRNGGFGRGVKQARRFRRQGHGGILRNGNMPAQWHQVENAARRKLDMLHAASALADLRVPPGNRLEAVSGDRHGQHSIHINQKWRVCFVWTDDGPEHVDIVDYH